MHTFIDRHIGLKDNDIQTMLDVLGHSSLNELTNTVVPESISDTNKLNLKPAISEEQALAELASMASQNTLKKSLLGQGYYNTVTPSVIKRNVLENPAWYTAYTPYQPEISQGRLEVLFYFQTMVTELTGMDFANASLLDEATAAAEGMTMAHRALKSKRQTCLVSSHCHSQTRAVLTTRAAPLGIKLIEFDEFTIDSLTAQLSSDVFAVIVQYPTTHGALMDYTELSAQVHGVGALFIMATDLLALTLIETPAMFGADIVVGNSQRFGVPLGFGGPHAGFFAVNDKYKRGMPGRLVGQSIDTHGNPAYRLTLQTREQHIRREKATSNICTAQALLAIMATLYACYHGPIGLSAIASRVSRLATTFADHLQAHANHKLATRYFFDTVQIITAQADDIYQQALDAGYNLHLEHETLTIAFDETSNMDDVHTLLGIFGVENKGQLVLSNNNSVPLSLQRQSQFMQQAVFHRYHSETEMMRYLRSLADKDIALDRSMIPLGSCTMKLNSASEMAPITWPEFAELHPFVPADQSVGYHTMIRQLEDMLCACTGYDQVSLQPNAGSQGEYAGLLAIKAYHEANGDHERDVCLIPSSAHGTNPASAQMANMRVVVVKCNESGDVDTADLDEKIAAHQGCIAAIMITYPSTHGVFENDISAVCEKVHDAGGQVYIDGANLNALVGLAQPGKFGGDVSHLNLHKTFCIPHGGGGPGVGPIGVRAHLAPFLPKDGIHEERQGATISAAPFGSASILPITWMYIRTMGADGLKKATQCAILSANYIAKQLSDNYPILFTGNQGLVAHECIIDTRPMKEDGVSVDDIAKRLIDYGFHAPTMSFPVAGTLMIEPTESESLAEIDRFCRAMQGIYQEYLEVKDGKVDPENNVLSNAPHTVNLLLDDELSFAYSRKQAAMPDALSSYANKYWPPVGRVDNVYGDKNLICSCPPMQSYEETA